MGADIRQDACDPTIDYERTIIAGWITNAAISPRRTDILVRRYNQFVGQEWPSYVESPADKLNFLFPAEANLASAVNSFQIEA